ncbi:hypothetical protein N658DRAFT_418743 [Parathielavia hyrcaniae]|uniref:Uncharacterized protein n=1 Tax=Parathielavia hyrcaniae TaxID=113614 RepID=A0AAN6Q7H7_9PEZI|nr:hypothetical protein N658DRAFT_418743 [Parathielavia hyrcaniae]
MAFDESIRALIDTYANCISLVKAFGQSRRDNGPVDARHQHSRLRKYLRSDRSMVERAYSTRLSKAGSRLKEGDVLRSSEKSPEAPKNKTAVPNRISILSFSSDSTKLGEIPERKWRSVMHYSLTDPNGDEYNVPPVFPLKPYTVEVRERRFLGFFRRRKGA